VVTANLSFSPANPTFLRGTFQKRENLLQLEKEMLDAAENLEFERAAELRDSIDELKKKMADGGKMNAPRPGRPRTGNRIAKPDPGS